MLSERINQLIGTLEEAWEQHHFKAFLLALRKLMDELQVEHHGLLQQEPSFSACVQHRRVALRHLREALKLSQLSSPKPLPLIQQALLEAYQAL